MHQPDRDTGVPVTREFDAEGMPLPDQKKASPRRAQRDFIDI